MMHSIVCVLDHLRDAILPLQFVDASLSIAAGTHFLVCRGTAYAASS